MTPLDKSNQVAFKPIGNETTWFHAGNGSGHTPDGESEDRLLEITQALWNNRGRLLRTALLGAVGTLIIALFIPNSYRSTTRLMPPDSQGGSGLAALASIASHVSNMDTDLMGGDLLKNQTKGDLLVGVLHSRTVQQTLVDKFDLQGVYGH
ncbi:MAG TPA: Wzz/FepE/Etk N-terminal domain-containing protein, partial [Terriglobales bacterium]|nr:Wzz/FepE/Etk N-terminal domain-containing protein [Terriglobales bacterium]